VNTFRLQLRFLVPLVLTLVAATYLALPLIDRLTLDRFGHDLDLRGALVSDALADTIARALTDPKNARLQALLDRTAQDERLLAASLCAPDGRLLARTVRFPASLSCSQAQQTVARADSMLHIEGSSVHVGMYPVNGGSGRVGDLVLLRDTSAIERRSRQTQGYLIVLIAALGVAIAIVTVVVAQLSWRGWVSGARALLRGEGLLRPLRSPTPELAPLAADLRSRLRDLDDEYRRARGPEAEWSPDRLRSLLHTQLRGDEIIVVSNREPYIHESTPAGIVVKRPASGLVTAVAAGTATITATTADGGKTATAAITVTAASSFTVNFFRPATWGTAIKIYWWGALPAGVLADGTWPGVAMTNLGTGWYSYTFTNITSTKWCSRW